MDYGLGTAFFFQYYYLIFGYLFMYILLSFIIHIYLSQQAASEARSDHVYMNRMDVQVEEL